MLRLPGCYQGCLMVFLSCLIAASTAQHVSAQSHDQTDIRDPSHVAATAWQISEVVLAKHINPPSRQQLFLQACRSVYRGAGQQVPAELSQKASQAVEQDEFAKLVNEAFAAAGDGEAAATKATHDFYEGLLHEIPGPVTRLSGKEYRVNESLRENRYVGIGIMLATAGSWPQIVKPFPGGPARKGGAKRMDLITSIDGVTTEGMPMAQVVDRLRGPKGTEVVVDLKSGDNESRTVSMVRDTVPIASVEGYQQDEDDDSWTYLVDEESKIAYLKVASITGSTAQEIRDMARRLQSAKAERLIVDLRGLFGGDRHHVVLIADALLSGGMIGLVETNSGVQSFEARDEAVMVGMPMVVLTDDRCGPAAEWLAAALQDNDRATVVGVRTRTNGFVMEDAILDPSGRGETYGVLGRFATGFYLRADGERLSSFFIPGSSKMLEQPAPVRNNNVPRFATDAGVVPSVQAFDSPNTGPDEALLEAILVLKQSA